MKRPLLILDLDETLIYGTTSPLSVAHDFKCGEFFIHKRPCVMEFIRTCARAYDLAVWTSSTSEYAAGVVEALFASVELEFVWARDRCTRRMDFEAQEHYWVKDLKKVKRQGFELARVLIVDDTPAKLERNHGNLVLVSEFTGDETDRELTALSEYLVDLAKEEDFRKIEKRGWR